MITSKHCKNCGLKLDISNFRKNKQLKDGHENCCKPCRKAQSKLCHRHICNQCGIEFTSSSKVAKFCSCACLGESKKINVEVSCSFCGKIKKVVPSVYKKNKGDTFFCDNICRAKYQKIHLAGEANPNYARVDYECDGCGKDIKVTRSQLANPNTNHIYCSNDCCNANKGKFTTGRDNHNFVNAIQLVCPECGKDFERKPGQIEHETSYCSRECYFSAQKKIDKKIPRVECICPVCDGAFFRLECQLKDNTTSYCSKLCQNIGNGRLFRGPNHPRFNSDLSVEERVIGRNYNEYYEWRKAVFSRDNYTCQCCGDGKGGNLVAHHYENYSENELLRTELDNGVTLCEFCHKLFHDVYGYSNNNKTQVQDFLLKFQKVMNKSQKKYSGLFDFINLNP